jgi:hypothetical protein
MKKKVLSICTIALLAIGAASCWKKDYKDESMQSEWLLPFVKGAINPLKLTAIKDKHVHFEIGADALGFESSQPITSPIDLSFDNVGSFEVVTNDLIEKVVLDTCFIDFKITNNFPTTLQAGTLISLTSAGETEPLINLSIDQDIAPGADYTIPFDLSGRIFTNKLIVRIETLKLAAFNDAVFSDGIKMDLYVKTVSLQEVSIQTKQMHSITDTTDFDGSIINIDEYDDQLDDSTVNANITFNAENELPINLEFQAYFLDNNNLIVDSMFNPISYSEAADYEGGVLIKKVNSKSNAFLSKQKLTNIKRATRVIYKLNFDSNKYSEPTITVTKDQALGFKLTGDVSIQLNPSNLF